MVKAKKSRDDQEGKYNFDNVLYTCQFFLLKKD